MLFLSLHFLSLLPGQHAPSRRPTRAMVTMGEPVVKLGTRGSPLALAQAYETKKRLAEAFPDELGDESAVEIKVIKTTGDLVLNKALAEMDTDRDGSIDADEWCASGSATFGVLVA